MGGQAGRSLRSWALKQVPQQKGWKRHPGTCPSPRGGGPQKEALRPPEPGGEAARSGWACVSHRSCPPGNCPRGLQLRSVHPPSPSCSLRRLRSEGSWLPSACPARGKPVHLTLTATQFAVSQEALHRRDAGTGTAMHGTGAPTASLCLIDSSRTITEPSSVFRRMSHWPSSTLPFWVCVLHGRVLLSLNSQSPVKPIASPIQSVTMQFIVSSYFLIKIERDVWYKI